MKRRGFLAGLVAIPLVMAISQPVRGLAIRPLIHDGDFIVDPARRTITYIGKRKYIYLHEVYDVMRRHVPNAFDKCEIALSEKEIAWMERGSVT
jgi:hypothetical protein